MRELQHLYLCCSYECARKEMGKFIFRAGRTAIRYLVPDLTITGGCCRVRFLPRACDEPERVYGSIIDSWSYCGNGNIHRNLIEYIKTHLGRERL